MYNRLPLFLTLAALLLCAACKKETPPNPEEANIGPEDWPYYVAADFGCKEGVWSDQYFTCWLDGKPFCRNATGSDTSYHGKGQMIVTDKPYIVVGGNNKVLGYDYVFAISDKDVYQARAKGDGLMESTLGLRLSYFDTLDMDFRYYLDSVLQAGVDLPLAGVAPGLGDVNKRYYLEVFLIAEVKKPGGVAVRSFASGGPQESWAFLRCAQKIRREYADHYRYFLRFEFSSQMYYGIHGTRPWRTLKDGEMVMEVRVPK